MNKLIVVAVLAGGGYAGYRAFFHKSEPVLAYEHFTQALLRGRYDEARALAAGDAQARFADLQKDVDTARHFNQLIGANYKVVSEKATDGGRKSTIQALQIVKWDPPGNTSAMGSMAVYHDQHAVVEQRDGAWKIVTFEDKVTRTLDWKGNPM
jgi:hypothetical protein